MDGNNFSNEPDNQDNLSNQNEQTTESNNNVYQDYTSNVQNQVPPTQYSAPEEKQTNVLAVVGMILGILSIIACCLNTYIAIIVGIAGLVCSILSQKQGKSGMAIAGIVCSIIGLVLNLSILVIGLVAGPALQEFVNQYGNYF